MHTERIAGTEAEKGVIAGGLKLSNSVVCLDCDEVFVAGATLANRCPACCSSATWATGHWFQDKEAA